MSEDPIRRLAQLRIIKLSHDLEVQLMDRDGSAVAIEILRRLRDRAAESLQALAVCNPWDRNEVLTLQNEVKRYDEWFEEMRKILAEGKQYEAEFDAEDREELIEALAQSPEGERELVDMGLMDDPQRGPDG